MFTKPAFGGTTSGFGSFNSAASTSSPFGGFKSTTTTGAFGAAPAFGANTATQPATGGGLFGSTGTTGGLFGGSTSATPTPAFGSTNTSGFGFGQTNATSGLFGGTSTTGGLFGSNQQQNTTFGAKPAGFGFGNTSAAGTTSTGLFGSTPSSSGLFGQQTNTMGGGGLFGPTAGAFGQQQQTGTAHVKYTPVVGTDVMMKGGTSQSIHIKHHCITCMKEYENKSVEELRLEDYAAGRRGNTGGMFGGFQAQPENKPLFGMNSFGQTATTSAPSVFGGGALTTTGFGQGSTFSFGGGTQTPATTNLFGAAKPTFGATNTTGTGLFGTPTTQQTPAFGTPTSTFGFGANAQNQTTNLFGAKPATSGFGATPAASTGFGGFGSTNTGTGLFGAKTATSGSAFGTTTPAFGALSGGFGTTTSTSGGIFGANNSLGAKPAQPTFGFGSNQQTGLATGLGGGLGSSAFQAKPAGSVFPSFSSGSSLFSGAAQPGAQPLAFGTGTNAVGGGLVGGLNFGTGTGLGGPSLGGLGTFGNNTANAFAPNNLSGSMNAGNVHEQILTLAARPYGDSSLFKDFPSDSISATDNILKPTNPAAVKALLDNSGYRVTSPEMQRLKVQPLGPAPARNKKSLFDGLEESDASLEDKLTLKPSRKRLVLRPQQNKNNETTQVSRNPNRNSIDDTTRRELENGLSRSHESYKEIKSDSTNVQTAHTMSMVENIRGINSDLEDSSERHGSWLGSSRLSWNESKELPADGQSTPRLYPDLAKEVAVMSERRASWLTTKPLRKGVILNSNTDSVDSTARELRIDQQSSDKENIDMNTVSEEENVAPRDAPPHPTGVKLTKPGYYTSPSLDDMISYIRPDGSCVVPTLTIGRKNYGNVYYDCEIDVAGLDLDDLVHFLNKEIIVYPDDSNKPPVGQGLNQRAIVTLDQVWPRDKTERRLITDSDRLQKMDYEGKLRRVCEKHDTKFIEYRPQTGSWVFRVEHFTKYGMNDSDEDEDPPDVLQRQLIVQPQQKPTTKATQPIGLGGLMSHENTEMQNSSVQSLNLFNRAPRGFQMDTSEDNNGETLYPDTSRDFGVKSPTSELARLEHRRSHHVQLMKASLYADTDMDDDMSVSTGDQLVPQPQTFLSAPLRPASTTATIIEDIPEDVQQYTEEHRMRPLVVRPHTVVLRHHRKVPPFNKTTAGRLAGSCIADMAVCRARHSRAGFGPGGTLAYVTTRDSVTDLSPTAELCDLKNYVRGRGGEDWSEPVVARIAFAGRGSGKSGLADNLSGHLLALLEFSDIDDAGDGCPQLVVSAEPKSRLALLNRHLVESEKFSKGGAVKYGVTGSYCYEVWKLCDALWAADLENDGVSGTDLQSIVNRYRKLLDWLTSAVSRATDEELSKPVPADEKDATDTHSSRVWTLLVGGRCSEACKVAREAGDLNMSTMIAQAGGDETVRALLCCQLSLWRNCGALEFFSEHRINALHLAAGDSGPVNGLNGLDWLRAFNVYARYICPQIPNLDQIVKTYETSFYANEGIEQTDLSFIRDKDETGMKYPVPPYQSELEFTLETDEKSYRVLDMRYELLRARANDIRPKLTPASYTPDPLDYSLSFLVGTWLGNVSVTSITGIAEQLEAAGLWHLAVQALMYHPDNNMRSNLVQNLVSRSVPARCDNPEQKNRLNFLRDKLKVPERWILLAQAHRAKYEHLPAIEVEHLVGAGHWNAAHQVLIDELLPGSVLADNFNSISPLLERMNEAAERNEVSGWESGGQALYLYLHVCSEIKGLVADLDAEKDRNVVHARLEALRPRVVAACRALGAMKHSTARHSAAKAEMGARLVQLALAAGEPPRHLAALLAALRLPPDYHAPAVQKITMDLAEEASESCAESTTSSPHSSHYKTAIRS